MCLIMIEKKEKKKGNKMEDFILILYSFFFTITKTHLDIEKFFLSVGSGHTLENTFEMK